MAQDVWAHESGEYVTVGSYLRVGAETVRVVDPAEAQVRST